MIEMDCTCVQKHHSIPTEVIEVSDHAIEKVAEILKDYRRIFMVADENTYRVAGRRVEEILKASGQLSHTLILPSPALPNAENVGKVLMEAGRDREVYDINAWSMNPDYILAVGSGSINDTCRMVSYRLGIPYGVAGTAPSMDGYASVVAPLLNGRKKIVYNCSIARHIIIDLSVNCQAPYPLLLSGVGDMIGKYVAILDWEISRDRNGEYYCEQIADMVLKATSQCIDASGKLESRDPEAIRSTSEGLILSGECIAFCGSSRPASGTEHMIGQTWEVMDVEEGKVPNLHGIEVGEGTFTAIEIFRKLYAETDDAHLKALIEKYLPAFDRIEKLQKTLKLPFTVTDHDRYIQGVLRGRTFRDRYTILQYLYEQGKLEEYAEAAYEAVMKKHFFGTFKERFPDWEA
ncbi:MAG: sn-glycerol-1-phosphate dehydrogenase [Clostridia bacterium]|nr:sn-glycerol-1-phosphate dehydrogenase [Clostridia bacterium]